MSDWAGIAFQILQSVLGMEEAEIAELMGSGAVG